MICAICEQQIQRPAKTELVGTNRVHSTCLPTPIHDTTFTPKPRESMWAKGLPTSRIIVTPSWVLNKYVKDYPSVALVELHSGEMAVVTHPLYGEILMRKAV